MIFIKKRFQRNDFIVLGIIVALLIIICVISAMQHNIPGGYIEISRNGEVIGTYSLDDDKEIVLKDTSGFVTNQVCIKNHEAYMLSASCPDHLCMNQGRIKRVGQTIVCLPNRIVVVVTEGETSEYDAIAR